MEIDVLMGPAEFEKLAGRSLAGIVCVVFDVLRATTSAVTALANGAEAILPVATIDEAMSAAAGFPGLLLAGEREGLRIGSALTGGREFNFGNSPREFSPERVRGRRIAMTTTNGTRALKACSGADAVLAGSFLNLTAASYAAAGQGSDKVLVICSGTGDGMALEDALAAGAFCECLSRHAEFGDAAWLVWDAWRAATGMEGGVMGAVMRARNARRLRSIPELSADVEVCLLRDGMGIVPRMGRDGWLRVG